MEKSESLNVTSLPREVVINNVFIWLDYGEIINYAKSCKSTSFILYDKYFWINKLNKNPSLGSHITHNDIVELFDVNNILPYFRYKYITDYYCYILSKAPTWGCIYIPDLAMKNCDIPIIKFMLKKYPSSNVNLYLLKNSLHFSKVSIVDVIFKNYHPDQMVYQVCFNDIVKEIINNRFYGCDSIVNNPNNYEIIEYILNNVNLNEHNQGLVMMILSQFKFEEQKLRKIMSIHINYINILMSIIIKDNFCLIEREYMSVHTPVSKCKYVSVEFLEWILNNYHLDENIMLALTNCLYLSYQKDRYIRRLSLAIEH